MKKILASLLLTVSLAGCAHNAHWVVPAAAGVAVGAAVMQASQPRPHQHYNYNYSYYPSRPAVYYSHPYSVPRPVIFDPYCRCYR